MSQKKSEWLDLPPASLLSQGQVGPGLREGTLGTSGEGQQGTAVWFGIEDPWLMVWGAT